MAPSVSKKLREHWHLALLGGGGAAAATVGGAKALALRAAPLTAAAAGSGYGGLAASHGAWMVYGLTLAPLCLAGAHALVPAPDREPARRWLQGAALAYALAIAALAGLDLRAGFGGQWVQAAGEDAELTTNCLRLAVAVATQTSVLLTAFGLTRAPSLRSTSAWPFAMSAKLAGLLTLGAVALCAWRLGLHVPMVDTWAFVAKALLVLALPGAYLLALPALGALTSVSLGAHPTPRLPIQLALGAVFALGAQRLVRWDQTGDYLSQVLMASLALPVLALSLVWARALLLRRRQPKPLGLADLILALAVVYHLAGGFTGLRLSAEPHRLQSSMYQVAHFHLVLLGGPLFALLASWARAVRAPLGRKAWAAVGAVALGTLAAYGPLFWAGAHGLSRRTPSLGAQGDGLNAYALLGAGLLAAGFAGLAFELIGRSVSSWRASSQVS